MVAAALAEHVWLLVVGRARLCCAAAAAALSFRAQVGTATPSRLAGLAGLGHGDERGSNDESARVAALRKRGGFVCGRVGGGGIREEATRVLVGCFGNSDRGYKFLKVFQFTLCSSIIRINTRV